MERVYQRERPLLFGSREDVVRTEKARDVVNGTGQHESALRA